MFCLFSFRSADAGGFREGDTRGGGATVVPSPRAPAGLHPRAGGGAAIAV